MGDHIGLSKNLIKDVEGFNPNVYKDSEGNPTIGAGLKLTDPDVRGIMNLKGIDPDEVISGNRKMSEHELEDIHTSYLPKREALIKNRIDGDLYESLPPHQKAAILSMGYQSLNNLGPKLMGRVADSDAIGAMREMILGTNKQRDPGILRRRFKEAEMYGGPSDFSQTFQTFTPEEKANLKYILDDIENPHTKKELMDKYLPYIEGTPQQNFQKLFQPSVQQVVPVQPELNLKKP